MLLRFGINRAGDGPDRCLLRDDGTRGRGVGARPRACDGLGSRFSVKTQNSVLHVGPSRAHSCNSSSFKTCCFVIIMYAPLNTACRNRHKNPQGPTTRRFDRKTSNAGAGRAPDGNLLVRSRTRPLYHANIRTTTQTIPLFSLICLDPGSGQKILAIWHGTVQIPVFLSQKPSRENGQFRVAVSSPATPQDPLHSRPFLTFISRQRCILK